VHGDDVRRSTCVGLELPADVLHVGIHRPLVVVDGDAVDDLEEL